MVFKKLRSRMIWHIIWIVSLITLIAFYFVYQVHKQSIRKHLREDALVVSSLVEGVLVKAMQNKRPDTLRELLPELSELHHIRHLRIMRENGSVAFSSVQGETGSFLAKDRVQAFIAAPEDTLTFHIHQGKNTTFYKWTKLKNREPCTNCHNPARDLIGMLWVETSDDFSFRSVKSDMIGLFGIGFGAIVFLSLAASALFIRSIDQPVRELRATLEAIKSGDFSARTHFHSKDELGKLATGINSMAEKLEEARRLFLEQHNEELNKVEAIAKIGELAAGLAHEIKNPISGIVFAANSILRETPPGDEKREILDEIVNQANRVEQNLEALLTFARQNRLERFPTNLNASIERILLFIRQQPEMEQIKTVQDLDANLPEILIDPKQIEQVLLNLVINAVQAMQDGGELTLRTRYSPEKKCVLVSIKDTGLGIPEGIKEKIFQPFFTTKVKGVGLGLVLCKQIISRHKGRIVFTSEAGKGTTFTIELPVGRLTSL